MIETDGQVPEPEVDELLDFAEAAFPPMQLALCGECEGGSAHPAWATCAHCRTRNKRRTFAGV